MIHIDEELYPDVAVAMKVATYVVLLPKGLKQFPDLGAIIAEAAWETRNEWVHEALCEALRLLDNGEEGIRLYKAVASHMASLIRRQPRLTYVEVVEGRYAPSAEDVYFTEAAVPPSVGEYLESVLTPRQWDMVRAYVSTGSPSEAAVLVGSSKANVLRAVRRARKILEGAGNRAVSNVHKENGAVKGGKLGELDTLFVLEGDGLTVTVADRRASVWSEPDVNLKVKERR